MGRGRKSKAKRFDGHKLQMATDTQSQLITAVLLRRQRRRPRRGVGRGRGEQGAD